jgi:hypothetical protein
MFEFQSRYKKSRELLLNSTNSGRIIFYSVSIQQVQPKHVVKAFCSTVHLYVEGIKYSSTIDLHYNRMQAQTLFECNVLIPLSHASVIDKLITQISTGF